MVRAIKKLTGCRESKKVVAEAVCWYCQVCGSVTMDSHQLCNFSKKLSDSYRAEVGLLTSDVLRLAYYKDSTYQPVKEVVQKLLDGRIQTQAEDQLIRMMVE